MNLLRCLLLTICAVLSVGCAATSPVTPGAQAILLDSAQTRHYHTGAGIVTFPKGRYEADFQTPKGMYYRAPTSMNVQALGIHVVQTGGLYLPNDKTQRQASWLESANGHTYAIEEPVAFRYVP